VESRQQSVLVHEPELDNLMFPDGNNVELVNHNRE
jgi:hypothetical protein